MCFDCACYPRLSAYLTNKLLQKATESVILGYNIQNKDYQCLDHKIDQVYISCHVHFNENHFRFSDDIHASLTPSTWAFDLLLPPLLLRHLLLQCCRMRIWHFVLRHLLILQSHFRFLFYFRCLLLQISPSSISTSYGVSSSNSSTYNAYLSSTYNAYLLCCRMRIWHFVLRQLLILQSHFRFLFYLQCLLLQISPSSISTSYGVFSNSSTYDAYLSSR